MAQFEDTQTEERAKVWLKPGQIEEMRNATVANSADYLVGRNDALIAFLADTGLRVGECVAVDVDMVDLDDGILTVPAEIQKDHAKGKGPKTVRMKLSGDTVRPLQTYLNNRWKESEALFPSRQSDRITTESVRNIVSNAAENAEIEPYTINGRGEPSDVTPHTLRHSLAYRMMNREGGNTFYAVRSRLRHTSISTTERIYDHFDVV